jgi:glycosyltransferase involved in cell wall biosynthesis
MTYLFTGPLPEHGTDDGRRRALMHTGRNVVAVSHIPFFKSWGRLGTLQQMLGWGPCIRRYNRHLLSVARAHRCKFVWIERGSLISPDTLQSIKRDTGARLICYSTDDIAYKGNYWRLHLEGIRLYDLYFTTNRFNVPELKALGARNVVLTQLGYDCETYKPRNITPEERRTLGSDVAFSGHWEPATERLLTKALSLGLPLRIRGVSWGKAKKNPALRGITSTTLLGPEDHSKAYIATTVNLGINSTQSRNLSSGRTFEIPASGAFMLAARTIEHQMFFEEDKEAVFFDSPEELVDKAIYYLRNEAARQAIAEAGHRRCVTSGYSWRELMGGMATLAERNL